MVVITSADSQIWDTRSTTAYTSAADAIVSTTSRSKSWSARWATMPARQSAITIRMLTGPNR